jgi:hypothetical protein
VTPVADEPRDQSDDDSVIRPLDEVGRATDEDAVLDDEFEDDDEDEEEDEDVPPM